MSRSYTRKLLDMMEDGTIGKESLIHGLLGWMEETDVENFCKTHYDELFYDENEEEDEEIEIVPVSKVGPHRTGKMTNISAEKIAEILGFDANCDDDPYKVKYSWGFTVNGKYAAIWDYHGSHAHNSWSTYDPDDVLEDVFVMSSALIE